MFVSFDGRKNRHCRTLTSNGVGQEGVGHSYQSAIIILVFPVVLGNRLDLHLNKKKINHSKLMNTL